MRLLRYWLRIKFKLDRRAAMIRDWLHHLFVWRALALSDVSPPRFAVWWG